MNQPEIRIGDDVVRVELMYPRIKGNIGKVVVGMCDVRASDNIEIEYDFDRDGWVVRMDETKDAGDYMEVIKEKVEVAFIPAWNEQK